MKKETIKKMAVFAGSIVLSGTFFYHGFTKVLGFKPFNFNKYQEHKYIMDDYGKDGISNKYIYTDEVFLKDSVVIKTPYYRNDNGMINRRIYRVISYDFSEEELSHIKNNINNQDLLLEKDYIQELINSIGKKNIKFLCSEQGYSIPDDNSYEISYATYSEDKNYVNYYTSKVAISSVYNFNYVVMTASMTAILYNVYFWIKKRTGCLRDIAKKIEPNADERRIEEIVSILESMNLYDVDDEQEIINKYCSFMIDISNNYSKKYKLNCSKRLVLEMRNREKKI